MKSIKTSRSETSTSVQALTKEYFESLAGWLNAPGILDDLLKEKVLEKAHDEKHNLRSPCSNRPRKR